MDKGYEMKKIAIYLRTSTKKQEYKSQLNEIKKYLSRNDIDAQTCKIYHDAQSGKCMQRKALKELQADMLAGKIESVYLYALDRLSRQGTESVMAFLSLANSKGVLVEFVSDQYLNHSDPLLRNILITVLSELARKEREKIVSRVKAGIEVAKKNGKRLGRPPIQNIESIFELRNEGLSLQAIADRLNISKTVVHKYLSK